MATKTETTIETEARDCADCAWREGTDEDRAGSADWRLTEADAESIRRVIGRPLTADEAEVAVRVYRERLAELRAEADLVTCTGCGASIPREDARDLGHSDTYSGTTHHCARCAAMCEA